jgi:hypothetical protein
MRNLINKLLKVIGATLVDNSYSKEKEKYNIVKSLSLTLDTADLDLISIANRELELEKQLLELAKDRQRLNELKLKIERHITRLAKEHGLISDTDVLKVKGSREAYNTVSRVPLDCTYKFNAKVISRSQETEARLQEQADRHDQATKAKVVAPTDNFYVKAKA